MSNSRIVLLSMMPTRYMARAVSCTSLVIWLWYLRFLEVERLIIVVDFPKVPIARQQVELPGVECQDGSTLSQEGTMFLYLVIQKTN